MQHQVLDIRAGAAGTTAKLYTYIRDESPEMEAHRRPAVVICPGGGYGMTSDREAEPVALKFLEKGFQCFVLRYSVEPVRFPAALLQLATAVATTCLKSPYEINSEATSRRVVANLQ